VENPDAATIDQKYFQYRMDTSQNGQGPITKIIKDKFNSILSGNELNNPRYADWLDFV